MKALREIQFYEITRTQRIDCGSDPGELSLNLRPTCGWENQNRESSVSSTNTANREALLKNQGVYLLIAQVLVSSDEGIEGRFGGVEKVAIVELGPAHFISCRNSVAGKGVAQWRGHSLVEEDPHAW